MSKLDRLCDRIRPAIVLLVAAGVGWWTQTVRGDHDSCTFCFVSDGSGACMECGRHGPCVCQGEVVQPSGSHCSPSGPCCLPDCSCVIIAKVCCDDLGGVVFPSCACPCIDRGDDRQQPVDPAPSAPDDDPCEEDNPVPAPGTLWGALLVALLLLPGLPLLAMRFRDVRRTR